MSSTHFQKHCSCSAANAVKYALNERKYLYTFLEDGDVPIDNNRVENAIRPFAIGQKNWLFSNTANGAKASAALYSLISTAKVNGLDAEKIPDRAVFKAGGNNIITVEGRKMKLSPDDAKLFYQLWLPLLNYVNGNYHVLVDDIDFTSGKIDPQDAAEVAHFLWERTEIIDDYLK